MHPAVRPSVHRSNVLNRKAGLQRDVPDQGFDTYLERLRQKPRSWLLTQVEDGCLVANIEQGVVSKNFVKALKKAYAEAKKRSPSPIRRIHE
jgi:hypothetical protein